MAVPSPASSSSPKTMLRRRMRTLRRDHVAAAGSGLVSVPEGFAALIAGRATLASYLPVGSEADPGALVAVARGAGLTIGLPHVVDREQVIRFVQDAGDGYEAGPFGLRQPAAASPELVPDVVLVPLLAFDRNFHRLGQGAGHYDRALAMLPGAVRVGVAFAVQEVEVLPVDPWDQPLDAVITEKGLRWRPAPNP